ncbi:hypothetical protein CAPTEDRAFT_223488 [Capitella teleta]|uniref:SH3 domain-containing protein n=1 Tax=Capitella teleta TaxID=283909 RepID=R7VID3_CAPTE|nr:hypothetical protein CAPTEDRAFT_223488 [Capitella teleta]|eukprot:ELU16056.1 hypothetical protein CAPTEDRAFT_223488 [Capitella teleta]
MDNISIYSMSPRQRRITPQIATHSPVCPPSPCDDIDTLLSRASRFFPANIPMVVSDPSTPLYDIDKRATCRLNRGEVVNALYKTSGWICVRSPFDVSGYVPSHALAPLSSKRDQQWYEQTDSGRDSSGSMSTGQGKGDVTMCSSCDDSFFSDYDCPVAQSSDDDEARTQHHFGLDDRVLKILYDYDATHFDDVSVRQHEVVTSSDHGQGWIWISRANGEQGYVPKSYVVDLTRFNPRADVKASYF